MVLANVTALTDKDILSFWNKADRSDANSCWLWSAHMSQDGYGVFCRKRKADGRLVFRAHRLAYILTNGSIPDNIMVRHICDVRPCINPLHLELGTAEQNAQDVVSRGRHWTQTRPGMIPKGDKHWSRRMPNKVPTGESHGSALLNSKIVKLIRFEYSNGDISQRKLASKYNVSQATIWQIVNNNYWKDVL